MFRRAVDRVSGILEWVSIACFIVMVLLVVVSVCLRPLHIAAPWSDEGACFLFIWTSFLSAAIALKRNLHIRIDVILTKLPAGIKGGFLWFLDLLCLPFCIGLLYGIYQMMKASLYMTSAVLETPMIYYYLPMFVGFSMMTVYLSLSIFDFFLKKTEKGGDR
ncbi:MAG: TRAP transporter small permease [Deltaproteobacteria bacterium]|jgi:TRAP-type C4-dicarboxylate transport system permease small subunit|nr:TRAP transporter small permease [Deltaproteobacteria bacterium]